MSAAAVWALIALALLAVTVGSPLLMRRTYRADDERQAVLDGNEVFTVGEGKAARLALRTPEGDLYERPIRGGIWQRTVADRAQAVATLNEEAA